MVSANMYIRTDLDIRRNDNYGLQGFIEVGTSRGGGGILRRGRRHAGLIRFDVSALTQPVAKAELDLTVHSTTMGPRRRSTRWRRSHYLITPRPRGSRVMGTKGRWTRHFLRGRHG